MTPESPVPDPYGGELVESGGFRVDREKALEKLNRFRDPGAGPILFWVRCAQACGATRMRVDGRADVEIRFDGRPLAEWALRDPFEGLFNAPEGFEAERCFSLGLLHASRPTLTSLSVASGKGAGRLRATLVGIEHACEPDASEETDTVIRLQLASVDPRLWHHPVPRAAMACQPFLQFWPPFTLEYRDRGRLLGSLGAASQAGPGELLVEEEGVRAHLGVPHGISARSRLDIYVRGVLAVCRELDTGHPAVIGKVDDPRLPLNASQTGAVGGERMEWLAGTLLPRLARRLLEKVAQESAASAESLARLLRENGYLLRLWERRIREGPGVEAEVLRGDASFGDLRHLVSRVLTQKAQVRFVLGEACSTLWLRNACAQLVKAEGTLPESLRRTPLFLTAGLQTVCFEEIRKAMQGHGFEVAEEPDGLPGGRVLKVWCESPEESRRFASLALGK